MSPSSPCDTRKRRARAPPRRGGRVARPPRPPTPPGSGPPGAPPKRAHVTHLILLHGALGDAGQLAPLAGRLGDDRAVTSLELEGHGATALRDRPFRIESFASAVIEEMDRLEIERADFFGYSMGGYVALYLAATAPARVARVATLATKLAWTPDVAAREAAMLDPATIRARVPKFAAALEARHTGAGWETLLAHTTKLMHELGASPCVTNDLLASIAQPVRIGVGDRDTTVSVEECAGAVRHLPNGELEVHPRTPHPFEKAPTGRIARSIVEFLA
jgi:pimeloyl-ACP methyl ester carboxylesterase